MQLNLPVRVVSDRGIEVAFAWVRDVLGTDCLGTSCLDALVMCYIHFI